MNVLLIVVTVVVMLIGFSYQMSTERDERIKSYLDGKSSEEIVDYFKQTYPVND